jgi:F-type H+-transporting ATPase subunit a
MGEAMEGNPFEHVMDSQEWEFLESLGLKIHLPGFLTKFMILELIVAGLIVAIYFPLAKRVQTGQPVRGLFWNAFESLLVFVRDQVAKPTIGEHEADRFVPFLWTMFLFVLFCNLLGLFPYMGSPTASIVVTAVLALFSGLVIHGSPIAKMGFGRYVKSYMPHMELPFGLGYFLAPMIFGIEIFGHFIKVMVLAVRLFANMFAGHTVLAVILMFIVMAKNTAWYLFWPVTGFSVSGVAALSLLELLVGFIQAYVFVFLTAIFLGSTLHPQH